MRKFELPTILNYPASLNSSNSNNNLGSSINNNSNLVNNSFYFSNSNKSLASNNLNHSHQPHHHHPQNFHNSNSFNHHFNKELYVINSNNSNLSQHYQKSPSALLTPGRKSASPTFFHYNHNNHSLNDRNHFNFASFNSNSTTNTNSSNYHQRLNYDNSYLNASYSSTNTNLASVFNHHDSNLKIPTTPTRSKSLSPSLRCVIQPPRMRHKNLTTTSTSTNKSTNESLASSNTSNHFKPINDFNDSAKFIPIEKPKEINKDHLLRNNLLSTESSVNTKSKESIDFNKKVDESDQTKKTSCKSDNENNNLIIEENSSNASSSIENSIKSNEEIIKPTANSNQTNEITKIEPIKIKLPLCVRMINLNNFPPNQGPNTKRSHSLALNKIKNSCKTSNSKSETLEVLQKNIQFIINDKITSLIEQFQKEFINPALSNICLNSEETSISNEEKTDLILNTIEQAQKNFKQTKLNANQSKSYNDNLFVDIESKITSNTNNSTNTSPTSTKSSSLSSIDLINCSTKRKLLETSENVNDIIAIKKSKIDFIHKDTLFVLGKSVNEIFTNETNNIYSLYPNLFKYEADTLDRNWLLENSIIERKNFKVYIFILDEIVSTLNDLKIEQIQKLKHFKLPEFILCKLKKLYNSKLNHHHQQVQN